MTNYRKIEMDECGMSKMGMPCDKASNKSLRLKEKLSDYQSIILNALEDYKRWFDDIEQTDDDKEKVIEINKAIEFVSNAE